MKILIVEPDMGGHHLNYLRLMSKALTEAGYTPYLLTSGSARDIYLAHGDELNIADVEFLPERSRFCSLLQRSGWWFFRQLSLWLHLKRALPATCERFSVHKIWFSYLDAMLHVWGVMGSPAPKKSDCGGLFLYQFVGFEQQGISVSGRFQRIKERLFFKFLRRMPDSSVCTILEPVCDFVNKEQRCGVKKINYVPDPVQPPSIMERKTALRHLGIIDSDLLVVIFGFITERKGIYELLKALKSDCWPKKAKVVCAGSLHADVRNYIQDNFQEELASGHLQIIDRFLRRDEEAAVYSIADLMWTGYKDFNANSGVLLQSVASGIPVIAKDHGMVGAFMRKHPDCGISLAVMNDRSITDTVKLFVERKMRVPTSDTEYVKNAYSEDRFREGIIKTVRDDN